MSEEEKREMRDKEIESVNEVGERMRETER